MGQEAVAANGTTGGGRSRPHAVVMPYPLQGHVIPAVHLALRLAERGFAVTFVNTESVHHQIGAGGDIFAAVRSAGATATAEELDVRYELVSDGFPLGFDRSLNHDQFMEGVLHVLPAHVEELLRRIVVDPATTFLVIDTFFVWPATLARKLGVPYVSFWTEPALIFNLYYHMDLLTKHGHFKCKEELVSDGLPVGFDRSLHHDDFIGALFHALPAHVELLLRRVVVDPGATFLVANTFFVARRLGVAYVSFWTEPALIFNLYYHIDLLTKNGHFRCSEPRKDTITYIPGVASIEPSELMSYLQETDTTSVVHRIIFKAFDEARRADYVLCNTVEELEPSTIAALRADRPFYAVGPILPAGFARSAVATSMWAESDCSRWLDAQPPASVLYISFGSYAHVTKQELHQIAGGVLASGARFLWVMRPDIVSSDDPDPLPEGFIDAAAGRGLVVQWCCQVEVLSHAAIGGFLTHCGWNSILESVWAGVPMLCFPLLTDQLTNRRLVVREWSAGVSIGDRGAVHAHEVSARIEGVMGREDGVKLREKVKKLRGTLEAAVAPGGSSRRSFDEFVDELKRRCGGRH